MLTRKGVYPYSYISSKFLPPHKFISNQKSIADISLYIVWHVYIIEHGITYVIFFNLFSPTQMLKIFLSLYTYVFLQQLHLSIKISIHFTFLHPYPQLKIHYKSGCFIDQLNWPWHPNPWPVNTFHIYHKLNPSHCHNIF